MKQRRIGRMILIMLSPLIMLAVIALLLVLLFSVRTSGGGGDFAFLSIFLMLAIYGIVFWPVIYILYWLSKTKDELTIMGGQIPTALLLFIPFANIYWLWRYFTEAERLIGTPNTVAMLVVSLLLGLPIIMLICQDSYNKYVPTAAAAPTNAQIPTPPQTF